MHRPLPIRLQSLPRPPFPQPWGCLSTVQLGGDPGARNVSSMEGEEPPLPRIVPMISVSAGGHVSSGKSHPDFTLLPNLETANLKLGPPLGLYRSSSLVVLGNTGHSLGMWPWVEGGGREGEGLVATGSTPLSLLLSPSSSPDSPGAHGCW